MKILAVDDDTSILEVLTAALSALEGHEVVTAPCAKRALRILDTDSEVFDCLLVDIQMPEMNGIEFCAEVRKRNAYTRTPILMLTAMSQRSYIADAFRAGATDYITKPFDLIDLRARLGSALRDRRRVDMLETRKADLDAPIHVRDVTRLLGQSEYENYVMQISQSLGSKSSVVGIKIVNIAQHHEALSPGDFERLIAAVAAAISELTRQEGHVISYRGNGAFLCIRIGRQDVLPAAFETILNRHIHMAVPAGLTKRSVTAVVGETIIMRSGSRTAALDALNGAIASVEAAAERSADIPDVSKRVLSNQSITDSQRQADRSVYSRLLRDVLRDEIRIGTARGATN
jgi:DNA-binding response OmpR family regulator